MCFRCASIEAIAGNTNVMPCENKVRGPIRVLSHNYWVKSMCYFLFRCNARALLLVYLSLLIKHGVLLPVRRRRFCEKAPLFL